MFIASACGGNCVNAGDVAEAEGMYVPELSETTKTLLSQKMGVGAIVGNPLDSFATWDAEHLAEVLELIDEEQAISMVILEHLIPRLIYHIQEDQISSISAVIETLRMKKNQKPTVVSFDYNGGDLDLAAKGVETMRQFCKAGIPAFPSIKRAIKALKYLYKYHFFKQREEGEKT